MLHYCLSDIPAANSLEKKTNRREKQCWRKVKLEEQTPLSFINLNSKRTAQHNSPFYLLSLFASCSLVFVRIISCKQLFLLSDKAQINLFYLPEQNSRLPEKQAAGEHSGAIISWRGRYTRHLRGVLWCLASGPSGPVDCQVGASVTLTRSATSCRCTIRLGTWGILSRCLGLNLDGFLRWGLEFWSC